MGGIMPKAPFVTKDQLVHIVEHHPTPFHLYDEAGIRRNMEAVRDAFAWNPGFREYFAVKANPNPTLIGILQEYGCGLDCSSATELMLAQALGCHGADIMLSANDVPAEDFRLAARLDATVNFDDITHIPLLAGAGGSAARARMLPLQPPAACFALANGPHGNPGRGQVRHDPRPDRPGLPPSEGAGGGGVRHPRLPGLQHPVQRVLSGPGPGAVPAGAELKEETGCHITFINLSGGVGIPYRPSQEPNDIMAIGEGVHQAYDEVLVPAGMDDVAIYTEMGRFILGPYGALVAQCIHQKHTYKEYAGLDACAANLMRPAMYGAYHHITVLGKENALCDHTYDVTGGLCENNDKFAVDRNLPQIDIGDYVYIHDTGAHGFSMGYNYNAKLRSAELLLCETAR